MKDFRLEVLSDIEAECEKRRLNAHILEQAKVDEFIRGYKLGIGVMRSEVQYAIADGEFDKPAEPKKTCRTCIYKKIHGSKEGVGECTLDKHTTDGQVVHIMTLADDYCNLYQPRSKCAE